MESEQLNNDGEVLPLKNAKYRGNVLYFVGGCMKKRIFNLT
jgi:hypothetical protein